MPDHEKGVIIEGNWAVVETYFEKKIPLRSILKKEVPEICVGGMDHAFLGSDDEFPVFESPFGEILVEDSPERSIQCLTVEVVALPCRK